MLSNHDSESQARSKAARIPGQGDPGRARLMKNPPTGASGGTGDTHPSLALSTGTGPATAKLRPVNISLPRTVPSAGGTITTRIFKEPVADHVMVRALNLDGDGQADLKIHGGRGRERAADRSSLTLLKGGVWRSGSVRL